MSNGLLCVGNEAREIATSDIHFDADAALTTFATDLRWAFFVANVGELRERDEVTFAIANL